MVQAERHFQVVEDALCQFCGFIGLFDVGLDQSELVTTQACQGAQPATVSAQEIGQG